MASFPEFMPTTPRLLNGFHTTMNDTDIDDVTDEDLTSSSSSYEYDRSLDLLTDVPVFTVYAITFLVGMTGNLLVIFAVVKSRRLHNVTCLFLANLAVADLLTVVFLIPLQIIVHSSDYWNLGDVLCRLAAYVGVISPVCSVFTMMIISLERYYVVLHPLQARSFVTMGRAKRVIAALWFFSCIFSSPALFSKKVTAHYWEEEPEPYSYTCNSAWPNETLSILYSVYLFLLLFFVPLIVVSYAYMRIACHLNSTRERSGEANGSPFNRPVLPRYRVWYRNTSGWSSGSSFVRRAEAASQANGVTIDEDATEAEALRSEPGRVENLNDSPAPRRHRGTSEGDKIQRVITMLAIVVALFILSWGPLLTYTLVYRFIDDMPYNTHAVLSLFLHLLAACNSCINPIIYAFLSKNFRQSFKQVIRECCCCCESLHRRRLAYQPSFRWTSSTRASYSYSPPESCMRVSPQRSTVSQKTDV